MQSVQIPQQIQGPRQSFFLLYVSLILIVLTVFIGTLYRPDKKEQTIHATDMRPLEEKEVDPFGSLAYDALFTEGSDVPNEAALGALVALLTHHDLRISIDLYPRTAQAGLAETLGQSVSLQRFFLKEGFPADYVTVYAHDQVSDTQARVQVYPYEVSS